MAESPHCTDGPGWGNLGLGFELGFELGFREVEMMEECPALILDFLSAGNLQDAEAFEDGSRIGSVK